jgi:WD40 repeat protein
MSEFIEYPDTAGDIEVHRGPFYIDDIAFSPTTPGVFGIASENYVHLGSIQNGRVNVKKIYRHNGPVHSVHFSNDGATLVSGSSDGKAIMFDVKSEKRYGVVRSDVSIHSAKFVRDKNEKEALATVELDKTLNFWDLNSISPRISISNHDRASNSFDYKIVSETLLGGHKRESYDYFNRRRIRSYLRSKESRETSSNRNLWRCTMCGQMFAHRQGICPRKGTRQIKYCGRYGMYFFSTI